MPNSDDPPVQAHQEPRVADAPFDDENADLILRSSDEVDFRVHKLLLSIASPFFRDMFSLPQPSQADEEAKSLPIVHLSEDAHTISLVLQCCYPIPSPDLIKLKDIRTVLDTGRKYDMSAVMHHGKITLENFVEKDVLGVFAVACRHGFPDICVKAARRSLHHALDTLDAQEFANISGAQVYALTQYHHRCCMAASSLVYFRACLSEGIGGIPIIKSKGKLSCRLHQRSRRKLARTSRVMEILESGREDPKDYSTSFGSFFSGKSGRVGAILAILQL